MPKHRAVTSEFADSSHAHRRADHADAFIPDPSEMGGGRGVSRISDDLAESLAEDFVRSALSGDAEDEGHEGFVEEEIGGPFVETTALEEFGMLADASNPEDATVEPLPLAVGELVQSPRKPDAQD